MGNASPHKYVVYTVVNCGLIPRPFPHSVLDHLPYANTEGEKPGRFGQMWLCQVDKGKTHRGQCLTKNFEALSLYYPSKGWRPVLARQHQYSLSFTTPVMFRHETEIITVGHRPLVCLSPVYLHVTRSPRPSPPYLHTTSN